MIVRRGDREVRGEEGRGERGRKGRWAASSGLIPTPTTLSSGV